MIVLIEILNITVLAILAWQDFKTRLVSLIVLGLLFLVNVAFGVMSIGLEELFQNTLINCVIITMQLGVCWLLFSIKAGRLVNFSGSYIGLGDILFFAIMAVMFSTINLIVTMTVGLSIIATVSLVSNYFLKVRITEIPLVGALAVLLIMLKATSFMMHDFFYFNDSWLINLLV